MSNGEDSGASWIEPFRTDIEALVRVECEVPSPEELDAFIAEVDETLEASGETMEEVWPAFTQRMWDRFSRLELSRARRSSRLHARLHDLYRRLEAASDEELGVYTRLRERSRASEMEKLMAGLRRRRAERNEDDSSTDSPR